MPTIHDQIDNYLAADLHNQLSTEERDELHRHLTECADCRKLYQEIKAMDTTLQTIFAPEKANSTFEQRMLAGFRTRVPNQPGRIRRFLVDVMRLRATHVAAVTALLLLLIGIGGLLTEDINVNSTRRVRDEADAQMLGAKTGVNLPARSAGPAQQAYAPPPSPVGTYRQDDIVRMGVRSSTDLVQKLPAAAGSTVPNETTGDEKAAATEELGYNPVEAPVPAPTNRKLIRNAKVELEIASFDTAVQKITAFASEERGYVATTSSEKQENGKLSGEVIVKVVPDNLDRFLQKLRGLGELKSQTLGTEDVTKQYFDTDARLKNARVMEQRLIDMLKTKTGKVADLLAVEKELGRVREEIEKMQGEVKFWDSQVQLATVTISLVEKDMEQPAAFLLKERARLALYSPEVDKIYNQIKALASPKVQVTNAQLDRDNAGRVSATVSMLIAPEESEGVIGKVKAMGRVENFQVQTERVAQGGEGMSENAKTKRDKVELNITISRDEQEQSLQQTSLRIRTSAVDEKTKELRGLAEKQNGRVRSSSFSRDPDGREFSNVTLRVPMKNYSALMQSLDALGKVENVSVQRQDRTDVDLANAPADLSIQVYSQGNIVSRESGLFATLRRTIAQSAGAIMWSLRMIGVAVAFLAPWVIALVGGIWIARRIIRARRS